MGRSAVPQFAIRIFCNSGSEGDLSARFFRIKHLFPIRYESDRSFVEGLARWKFETTLHVPNSQTASIERRSKLKRPTRLPTVARDSFGSTAVYRWRKLANG